MKNLVRLFAIIFLGITATQCAKQENESFNTTEERSLDAWMKENHPGVEKTEFGIYIEWLRPSDTDAPMVETTDWVRYNTKITCMDNTLLVSRYEEDAVREGTFSRYTHYVPHYNMFSEYLKCTHAEFITLTKMHVGDSVRIYSPSRQAFQDAQLNAIYGYEGWVCSDKNPYKAVPDLTKKPVIIDLVLKDIIKDPKEYEMGQVEAKAQEWGLNVNDTIRKELYFSYIDEDLTAPKVAFNDTIYIEYTGRFFDGFLFDTNEPQVAANEWNEFYITSPGKFIPSITTALYSQIKLPSALKEVFRDERIRYNSKFKVLLSSDWAAGVTGISPSVAQAEVAAYTPFIYEITVRPKDYKPAE